MNLENVSHYTKARELSGQNIEIQTVPAPQRPLKQRNIHETARNRRTSRLDTVSVGMMEELNKITDLKQINLYLNIAAAVGAWLHSLRYT